MIKPLSEAVHIRVTAERGLSHHAAASLRMVEHRGSYSGRRVTFFRVFDPATIIAMGIDLRHFEDLDTHQRLQLHTGHVESDGLIVLNRRREDPRGNVL